MAYKNVPLETEFESFIFEFERGSLNDCIRKKKKTAFEWHNFKLNVFFVTGLQ